jgi:hypothetical protein
LSSNVFSGITVVFGGDLQQTLPIVVKGSQEDIVHATLQSSPLWNDIHVLYLQQNMCVHASQHSHTFPQWLLDIRHGHAIGQNTSTSIFVLDVMHDLMFVIYGTYHALMTLESAWTRVQTRRAQLQ